jgi:hypothetical protein
LAVPRPESAATAAALAALDARPATGIEGLDLGEPLDFSLVTASCSEHSPRRRRVQRYKFGLYRTAVRTVEFLDRQVAARRVGFEDDLHRRLAAPRTLVIEMEVYGHVHSFRG